MRVAADSIATPRSALSDPPYRITAAEFRRMVDSDVFAADQRIYLWEGSLYEKTVPSLPHAAGFSKLVNLLLRLLADGWTLWPKNPITLAIDSVPLPDIAVIRGVPDDYCRRDEYPGPADIGLIMEISEGETHIDATRLEAYARTGIPAVWLVNLVTDRVMVYSVPLVRGGVGTYADIRTYGSGETVPFMLDGVAVAQISVDDILLV